MAAVSLFWNTNIAAVTSCENAVYDYQKSTTTGFGWNSWSEESTTLECERIFFPTKKPLAFIEKIILGTPAIILEGNAAPSLFKKTEILLHRLAWR